MRTSFIPEITNPLGRCWEQPPRESILVTDLHAVMSLESFDKLASYDFSQPSALYVGKMWKSCRRWLHYVVADNQPGYVNICSREIILMVPQVGPNIKRLIAERCSGTMVEGGFEGTLANLLKPGRLQADMKEACEWVKTAIAAVRAAALPNPWKALDDEAIAGEILRRIEEKKAEIRSRAK